MHVVATAGHVDHGKSTLVRALTGMEPDRWAEERRRGLTIDLGYAWTTLPGGADVAFVDVPGHERFIANMLAGLGPAPFVLFVVAADSGWSRQSEEHLRAVDALDVRHGLLAVTRSDLADPAPALAAARERIARSSLGEIDAVPVSGATAAGLDELRAALDRLLTAMPRPDPDADVRLWLDRAFTVKGSGTVVTATLSAGRVAVGDELELHDRRVIVRGLESLEAARDSVAAPARVALNLRAVGDVHRGDVLVTPGRWHRTNTVDVRLDIDAELPAELTLHVGTAALPVRLRPLGAFVGRLSLPTALPLRAGDRAVLRDPGRQQLAAGALVLDADPPALQRRGAARARAVELADADAQPDVRREVARRGYVSTNHLQRLGIALDELGDVRSLGRWLVSADQWQQWVAHAATATASWADAHRLQPAMPLAALRHALALPDDPHLLRDVVTDAGLVAADGHVRRPDQVASLGAAQQSIDDVVAALADSPFAAPERDRLAELGLGRRELAAAERAGALLRVGDDIVLLPSAPDEAVRRLRSLPPQFTLSEARQALGSTRRVVVPLLEYLDRAGRTERVDDRTRRVVG